MHVLQPLSPPLQHFTFPPGHPLPPRERLPHHSQRTHQKVRNQQARHRHAHYLLLASLGGARGRRSGGWRRQFDASRCLIAPLDG